MPPALQVDNTGLTSWEDYANAVVRSTVTFGGADAITFASGNGGAAIRLANVGAPTYGTDAVNKAYVDAAVVGLTIKTPARVALLANAASLTEALAPGATVDGVTLVAGDRVLVMGQTVASQNGIYVVAADAATAPARAGDLAVGSTASGAYLFVDQGTALKDRGYVCITDRGVDVVGTGDLTFVQFSARSSAIAGNGLVVGTGEAIDVNVDDATLTIAADTVLIKDAGVTNAKIADATIANAKLVNPALTVNTARGLTGGQSIALGAAATVAPDFTVIPDKAAANTFAGATTFLADVTAPRVTGLAAPASSTDAVNLSYVTSAIQNASQQGAVRAAVVGANVALATGGLAAGAAVDGLTLATGDRVLLTGQTAAVENGIYVVAAAGAPSRSSDLAAGAHASGYVVTVRAGTLYGGRLFLCTNASATTDVVGTDALTFAYVAQSLPQAAGVSLQANAATAALDVRTDDVTIETDGATNRLRLRDAGITNAKIADATVANAKLVHPSLTVNTNRGLLGGQTIDLGASAALAPDFTVVPDLAASNTFAQSNTFQGTVHVTSTAAATSQSTGALVVDGGVGIGGDVYSNRVFNMSDINLKTDVQELGGALGVVQRLTGRTFRWRDIEANTKHGRVAGSQEVGFIAQEVRDAGADLCVTSATDSPYLAVEYSKIVVYAVEAIKELENRLVTMEARLDADVLGAARTRAPPPVAKRQRRR